MALVAMTPAELGQLVLKNELHPSSEFNRNNLSNEIQARYPREHGAKVSKALMEALSWLARQGLIADSSQGNGWYFISKAGELFLGEPAGSTSATGRPEAIADKESIAGSSVSSATADTRLASLLSTLDPTNSSALRSAWSIKSPEQRVHSLLEIASQLPTAQSNEIYDEVVRTIPAISDIQRRAEITADLAKRLPESLLVTLLERVKDEPNAAHRVRVISRLLSVLPLTDLQQLSEYARALEDQGARDSLLSSLSGWMAERGDVELGLSCAEAISDSSLRDNAIAGLMRYTKKLVDPSPSLSVESNGGDKTLLDAQRESDTSVNDATTVPVLTGVEIATRALSDAPNAKSDLLDFADYADALEAFISSEKTEKPLTVGIDAAWGMGKTQLMRMIQDRLKAPGGVVAKEQVKVRPSFPTVWFNAWKYDKEETLWAALVVDILEQINRELTIWQRLSLSFRLGWRRFDKKSFSKAFTLSGLSFIAVTVVAGIWLGGSTSGVLGFIASIYPLARNIHRQFIEPLGAKVSKYVRDPDYRRRIGFLSQFEQDFARVVDLVTKGGKWPLVVFIDDLDRCSPAKAVEVIEAINLFLDAKHCVFVIGMDATAVARSIETKYKDLKGVYSDDQAGLTLGERFLEKIIQISFHIPPPHRTQIKRFIEKNLAALGGLDSANSTQVAIPHEKKEIRLAEHIIQAEQRTGKDLAEATRIVEADTELSSAGISRADIREASEAIRTKAFEDDNNVRQAIIDAAPYLENNPRKIKRFINNFRLAAFIAQRRELMHPGGVRADLLAKAVIVSAQWPGFAKSLVYDFAFCSNLRKAFEIQKELRQSRIENTKDQELLQMKLDSLLQDERVKRLLSSNHLSDLLTSVDNSDLENLARCFQVPPTAS